jgi:hypothetical protein
MREFFPRTTGAWKTQDAESFRRLSVSVLEMGVITGVVLRIYRALVLSRGASDGWLSLSLAFALFFVLLFGMVTLHLGNFPVRHWLWRAPAFAVIEAITESLMALALIALNREPLGSARAEYADWPSLVTETFIWRVGAVIVFAALLAGVVQLMRFVLLTREHRSHTFQAVHAHGAELQHSRKAAK